MSRKDIAQSYHNKGYNCAQSVSAAFTDLVDIDSNTLFAISEGFGFGMGGADESCGALTGAIMILSLLLSSHDPGMITKANTYKEVKALRDEFNSCCKSTICRELKGLDNGVVLTSCPDCINRAVECLEAKLDQLRLSPNTR